MNRLGCLFLEAALSAARKMGTLSSVWMSYLGMIQDGQVPGAFDHRERLAYLELRNALNWKRGIVVYDIGANTGSFARFAARLRTVGKVYCFEPAADVFETLLLKCNEQSKIECLQAALGDRAEKRLFHVNEFAPSSSILPMQSAALEEFPQAAKSRIIELQVTTLAEIVAEKRLRDPDFIKVDVQGFEDRVIRGGLDVFRKARFCMLEMSLTSLYQDSILAVEMNDLMRGLGFKLAAILDHKVKGKSGEILQFDAVYENGNYKPQH